jgi:GMP synthase (glutamine-hydrolysing)
MLRTILCIQFRQKEAAKVMEQTSISRAIGDTASVRYIDALDTTLPWESPEKLLDNATGVILGGSGDFDFDGGRELEDPARLMSQKILTQLHPLFTHLFTHDVPTLGICYGHQLLGAFAGAQVVSDPTQKKSRSHEVEFLVDQNDHFLMADLPLRFSAFYSHKDALDRVPEGALLLMHGGTECKVSALQYKNNIYSTQFHPELTLSDMLLRLELSPDYLPEGVTLEDAYQDDTSANQILINFGRFIRTHHETTHDQELVD